MQTPHISEHESQRLAALQAYDILDTPAEAEFDDLTMLASIICGTPIALVSLIDTDRQWFKSSVGLAALETPRVISFCGHAINQPSVLLEVPDALEDLRFADNPLVTNNPNIRFYAGAPLVTTDGYALGTLCVIDTIPRQLSSQQREALLALSRHAVRLIEKRLMPQLIKAQYLAYQEQAAMLRNQEQYFTTLFEKSADPALILRRGRVVNCNQAALNQFACTQKTELVGMSLAQLSAAHQPDGSCSPERLSVINSLALRQGSYQFEWLMVRQNGSQFNADVVLTAMMIDGELLLFMALRDVTEKYQLQHAVRWQASHDALTGLPNRTLLTDRFMRALSRAQRQRMLLAVCMIDLDEFKPVNDQYGHEVGDLLLIEVASRLKRVIRGEDTAARLGGDEFVLLLSDVVDVDELALILTRVLAELGRAYAIQGHMIMLSASIGCALYPRDDADADTLLRHADQAMYQAKQRGRNQFQLFDVSLDTQLQFAHRTQKEVKNALLNNELVLYYQPKVNMRTGVIVGMEALIRWQHPTQGIIPPLDFLPQVEKTDLIIDIGQWVIEQTLQQIAAWQQLGKAWKVSVNIAAWHFQHSSFLADLRQSLMRHPEVSPNLLEIEILESVVLGDINLIHRLILDCQALGVSFSLDDFGTGYSSLSYLKRLPAETIKIDQSFVRDILDDKDDLALVEAVIGMGRVFNRQIVAEGVETPEHGVLLMRLGCDHAQGYGIARPMPVAQIMDWAVRYVADTAWAMWADTEWEMRDFPLLVAQYDHSKWVKSLVLSVEHPNIALNHAEIIDAHHCRFGHWYDGCGAARYQQYPEYMAIAPLHNSTHEVGMAIIQACAQGEQGAAKLLCTQLLDLKDRILVQLAALQKVVMLNHYTK